MRHGYGQRGFQRCRADSRAQRLFQPLAGHERGARLEDPHRFGHRHADYLSAADEIAQPFREVRDLYRRALVIEADETTALPVQVREVRDSAGQIRPDRQLPNSWPIEY